MSSAKEKYLKIVNKLVDELGRYPTRAELVQVGVSRDAFRGHFGTLEELYKQVKSDKIFDVNTPGYSTKVDTKKKRFVVTTAVTDAKVNRPFLKNLKAYCKKFDAQLLVMVSVNKRNSGILDPVLKEEVLVVQDTSINSNLFLLGIKNTAKRVDPITGLPRVGKRNGSFISASPKQRLKYVATANNALPHALMSTGAVTLPDYTKSTILTDQSSYLAEQDHVMGAIVVELDSKERYHFRQIQANEEGNFFDMGYSFAGGKYAGKSAPVAMVFGDWHSGQTDLLLARASTTLSDRLGVKEWIWHDVFDGQSISHHNVGKQLLLARKSKQGKLNLEAEVNGYIADLKEYSRNRRITIVRANHDEHLDRYLDEGRFMQDPQNIDISLELAKVVVAGEDPLQHAALKAGVNPSKVKWLSRDEDYYIEGIQCGAHGDKGANGSRGSINAMENAYGDVIFGHAHTPQILRGAWCVGTSTAPTPDYGTGPSSWMQTHCLIYPGGMRQMVNFIGGKFTTIFD